jgi:hypothetical protein
MNYRIYYVVSLSMLIHNLISWPKSVIVSVAVFSSGT